MYIGEKNENFINSDTVLKYFKYQDRFTLYKEFVEIKIKKEQHKTE